MGPPMPEDPFLTSVRLTPWLARKHEIEEAHFADGHAQQLCLGPPMYSSGLPPCLQQEASLALTMALRWWNQDSYLRLGGTALLTAGRLMHSGQSNVLDVCGSGDLCSAIAVDEIPAELILETEPDACIFHSARDVASALPPLLRVQRGCEDPADLITAILHDGRLKPIWLPFRAEGGEMPAPPAHVLSCLAIGIPVSQAWLLHAPETQLEGAACLDFIKRNLDTINLDMPAVLLSPSLLPEKWTIRNTKALEDALQWMRKNSETNIMGFPLLSEDSWRWKVRRLRHQYWKLFFTSSETIEEHTGLAGEPCAVGFPSATRAFGAARVLRSLLSLVESDPDNPWNWLLDMDLQIHKAGTQVLSCAGWPMPEVDYLTRVTLTEHMTTKHQVELANFDGREDVYCIKGANWFQVAQKGLVAPYCFRRDVMKAFRRLRDWWTSLDARNFLVPEEGTFLALFRNGNAGIMPWDSDFDVKLYSEQDLTMEGFMNRTLEPEFKAMQIEAYAYDGCGQDSYVLLRQANITHHIGDAYVRGSQKTHPWKARLFGTEIRLSPEHLEHIFFTRYRTPVQKLFGDGIPLQCFHPGHNACMPDCQDPTKPCDFEDHFVHV
ncbi:unnamed protein product [Durusdinium trenchii]|uniref:Uncharacterized protein n=1 Tax=Durusdinium trenchii TaxID=1381693 RepID=A0ABP0PH75_9DINO